MTPVFLDSVVRTLDAAVGPNTYVVESSQSDPRSGNAAVTVALGNLRVRFVREWGQTFVSAKSGHERRIWHELRILADHVRRTTPVRAEQTISLEANVELLATFRETFAEVPGPGYETAKHDLAERHRIGLGGRLGEWLKEHPPEERE